MNTTTTQSKQITFLGPVGATFSHDAYEILAQMYGAPAIEGENVKPATVNGEVLKMIQNHNGYGTIAMETLAEGRVAEPVESFIELLGKYPSTKDCSLHIIAAIKLKLHFCLMTRKGVSKSDLVKVIAHPKALGACKKRIEGLAIPTVTASSNGEAARLIAENDEYKMFGALGPKSAATKYGLDVLETEFEDREAVTTFFLIGPQEHKRVIGEHNRVLIVYRTQHKPGSLVRSLLPFEKAGLNLIQIHSVHVGDGVYHFAIELEVDRQQIPNFDSAMVEFGSVTEKHLCFGPFEVLSR